jgi:hypothetical protein
MSTIPSRPRTQRTYTQMARPRTRVETTNHATDPAITLIRFRRSPTSKVYEAQIGLPDGSKKIVSTGETDAMKAQFTAVRLKEDLRGRVDRTGSPALRVAAAPKYTGPTFADAAKAVIADLDLKRDTERYDLRHLPPELLAKKLSKYRQHINRIEKFLIPQLGHLTYDEVSGGVIETMVQGVRVTRRERAELGQPRKQIQVGARQSTIGNLAHTYKMCADKLRRISNRSAELPKVSRSGMAPGQSRDSFEDDEMRRIIAAMSDEWLAAPKRASNRAIRRLLRAYVHICATTGIRPGLEMERLAFGSFRSIAVSGSKHAATGIGIRKNDGKYPVARWAVAFTNDPFADFDLGMAEAIRSHGGDPAPGALLFALPADVIEGRVNHRTGIRSRRTIPDFNSTFRGLLTDLDLRFVPGSAQSRSLYSLRHYYAIRQIHSQMPIYDLAQMMGTSVKMIEKYYGKALSERNAGTAAGFMAGFQSQIKSRLSREAMQERRSQPDGFIEPIEEPDAEARELHELHTAK